MFQLAKKRNPNSHLLPQDCLKTVSLTDDINTAQLLGIEMHQRLSKNRRNFED